MSELTSFFEKILHTYTCTMCCIASVSLKLSPFFLGASILDIGTGGGFPGVPLAIFFPDTHFVLVDGKRKKIKVVQAIVDVLGLANGGAPSAGGALRRAV